MDHRPALRALGRGAPAGRFQQDALLDRHDDPALGLAAGPGPLDRPRLEVGVGQAILLELVAGPLVGLGQARRAGQPRPDHVAEVLDVGHQLRALVDLLEDRLGHGLDFAAGLGQRSRYLSSRRDLRLSLSHGKRRHRHDGNENNHFTN